MDEKRARIISDEISTNISKMFVELIGHNMNARVQNCKQI
jgi:hypothetical protein